ncbi:hypothetical protein T02_9383, partial [Trichinella nativa]
LLGKQQQIRCAIINVSFPDQSGYKEKGKAESVVQQMDDSYTRETGFVRSSAAYGVQE